MLVNKYEIKNIDEIIGHDEIKKQIKEQIKKKEIPNFLFIGRPGTGKTSMGEAISYELFNRNTIEFVRKSNASDDRTLKFVREKIKNASRTKGGRIIFLDEFDNMHPDAQKALREIISNKLPDVIFILTANYPSKIIDAIHSRFATYVFKPLTEKEMFNVFYRILKNEEIKITNKNQIDLIKNIASYVKGDARKGINELEKYITADKTIIDDVVPFQLDLVDLAFEKALAGDDKEGINYLENAYLSNSMDHSIIAERLYTLIATKVQDNHARWRLFEKLSDVCDRLDKSYVDHRIHLGAFIAYVCGSIRLPKCPLIDQRT